MMSNTSNSTATKRKEPSIDTTTPSCHRLQSSEANASSRWSSSSSMSSSKKVMVRRPRLLSQWIHPLTYHGVFRDGIVPCVTIHDPRQIEELHVRGCYGRASLSRHAPAVILVREQEVNHHHDGPLRSHLEALHLSLMEAFWLKHTIECLKIYRDDEHKEEMSTDECWLAFRRVAPRFVPLCAAYYYYRTRSWVVKSGIKFGVDYVIYQDGPSFTHAQYSIIVEWVTNDIHMRALDGTSSERVQQWIRLQNHVRLTSTVAKSLSICYVLTNMTPITRTTLSSAGRVDHSPSITQPITQAIMSDGPSLSSSSPSSSTVSISRPTLNLADVVSSSSSSISIAPSTTVDTRTSSSSSLFDQTVNSLTITSSCLSSVLSIHTVVVKRWTPQQS